MVLVFSWYTKFLVTDWHHYCVPTYLVIYPRPCFVLPPSPVMGLRPPGVFKLSVAALCDINHHIAPDEFSRWVTFLLLCQTLTFVGQKWSFTTLCISVGASMIENIKLPAFVVQSAAFCYLCFLICLVIFFLICSVIYWLPNKPESPSIERYINYSSLLVRDRKCFSLLVPYRPLSFVTLPVTCRGNNIRFSGSWRIL